jgi:hypothetical protein
MARLNKVYANQNYTVNRLAVVDGEMQAQPQRQYKALQMQAMAAPGPNASNLSVSNELIMSAFVEAGSSRNGSCSVANK